MKKLQWIAIAICAGLLSGSASALFLVRLSWVTNTQTNTYWLLWLLPLGGALVSYIYMTIGKEVSRGNNLIFEHIHSGNGIIPLRMAPLVLFGTLITHLFGGSAGREGTAVQMGGSLSSWLGTVFKLNTDERKLILLCGISGGFGSVFGTPIAAAIFGLEVTARSKSNRYLAIFPCLIASYVGHYTALAWGIKHSQFSIGIIPKLEITLLVKVVAASILFGLAALLFVRLTQLMKKLFTRMFSNPIARGFAGGLIIVALVYAIGSRNYLGLGIPLIAQAFQESVSPSVFLLKTLFTSITLGAGFIGGEVTPLFVIGSTLGSAIAQYMALPASFLAAIGFAAVFGAAAKAPVACIILGMELFGLEAAPYLLVGCFVSFFVSGRIGIYETYRRQEDQPKRWR